MAAKDRDALTGDWDPVAPEVMADYPAAHQRLRAEAPVAWSENWGGFYTLMRHADVSAASRDPGTFTATRMTVIPSSPRKGLPRLPLQKDPPDSDRYRKALNPFFKENRIRAMEPALQSLADRLIARLDPAAADFSGGFVEPFTQGALGLLIGLDEAEALEVGRLSHIYVHAVQGEDLATAGDLSRQVDAFAVRLVENRIAAPRDPETDIVSGLIANPPGTAFTPEELAGMVRLMLIGGHVVPRNFLCSIAWHMATRPDHLARLRDDPTIEKPMIEEFLRFYASNQALVRVATKDTRIGDTAIPAGCPVALNFLSANRDETVFERPMEFIPDRKPNRHLAFGIGPHMCLGLALAKLQARIVLKTLLAAPGLAVTGTPTWARWTEYGITALTLDLRPTP
ncbi:cytochrome P450 [Pseudooceanicola sp.]|uniref:cytochrome P450 n=1 Tax=Pseudooceanicola sp. TaxID=1914328 RepID=UPI004058BB5E